MLRKRIAIIGAGISGLTIAQELYRIAEVTVFEKARGVGGRMSTRYADPFCFDSGVQCFTARTEAFQNFLKPYFKKGIVREWSGAVVNLEVGQETSKRLWLESHLVASPNMNSLCKELANGINIKTSCEVAPLEEKSNNTWNLLDKAGNNLGNFDWVIVTAPPVQTVTLFDRYLPINHILRSIKMQPCYAMMIGLMKPWTQPWIAAKVRNSIIKWISVNSSKPGRDNNLTCLVLHSKNNWAAEHINCNLEIIQSLILDEFKKVTRIDLNGYDYLSLHRWLYAVVDHTQKPGHYMNTELRLAATSDWCQTSRIEEVWCHAKQAVLSITKNIGA